MSKHNYSQYSNKNNRGNNQNINQKHKSIEKIHEAIEVKMDTIPVKPVETVALANEAVETVALPNTVKGIVSHCAKLNVRENATVDSGIVCVLDAMSEIEIDVNKSTSNWFYIYSATGAEGYCMRQYVDAHM